MIKKENKNSENNFDLCWFLDKLKENTTGIEYISGYRTYSRHKSVFECVEHGKYSTIPHLVLKRDGKGCPSCTELARRKPVCGVGNNDVLGYDRRDYYLWYNVVRRGTVTLKSYEDVTCHEDWLTFSKFLEDLPLIDNFEMRESCDWELDKDLLSGDRKIYSKDTTCFLPREINSCIAVGKNEDNIVGVIFDKEISKFFACLMMNGRRRRFGSFYTTGEAFEKYKELKMAEVSRLAEKHRSNLTDRVYEALKAWTP